MRLLDHHYIRTLKLCPIHWPGLLLYVTLAAITNRVYMIKIHFGMGVAVDLRAPVVSSITLHGSATTSLNQPLKSDCGGHKVVTPLVISVWYV